MAKIRITPETLEGEATKLDGYRDNIFQLYNTQISTLVINLVNEWEGTAQTAFKSAFDGYKPQFDKFNNDLTQFISLMKTAAAEMRATEESLTSKMHL